MTKRYTAILLLLGLAASRAADLGTTHYFLLGDMSGEANPLASVAGLAWPSYLAWNIGMSLVLGGGALFYGLGKTKFLKNSVDSVAEFGGICLYNRAMNRGELTRRLLLSCSFAGIDWYQMGRFLGMTASVAVITVGFAATFCWWGVNAWEWEWLAAARKATAIGYYSFFEIGFAMIAAIIASIWFFRSEWKLAASGKSNGEHADSTLNS